ncbi:MAG: hypothetical protein D6738_11585 [Acidobacteria bacterium]|nr:MAG: hypothetical protein D6738_11585 [Acidobacteriota bacterium]
MIRYLTIAVIIAMLAGPAAAAEATGEITAGGLAALDDGDQGRFREHSGGLDSAPFVDIFRWHRADETRELSVAASVTAGQSGWFDLRARNRRFGVLVRGAFHAGWSDTSFADDVLPSGAAVSGLVPPSTALPDFFGVDEPHADRYRFEALLTHRFRLADRVWLRVATSGHDGERVPSIGGFAFADNGLTGTWAAGLEEFDSSSTEAELGARVALGKAFLRLAGGLRTGDIRTTTRLPAWGQTALLDLNTWVEDVDLDETWAVAGVIWPLSAWSFEAHASLFDATFTPRSFDRREQPDGTLVADGLAARSGDVDRSRVFGALGATWTPRPGARLVLAADMASVDQDGAVALDLAGAALGLATTSYDEDRVGFLARGALRFGRTRLRIDARVRSSERTIDEAETSSVNDLDRDTDLVRARVRVTTPLGSTRLEAWGRWEDRSTTVTVRELTEAYATGDWDETRKALGARLRFGQGATHAALSARWDDADIDVSSPFFDPVFDPSVTLELVGTSRSDLRLAGSLVHTWSRGDAWAEIGWTNLEWVLPEEGVRPTYALVSEDVDGLFLAFGGTLGAWRDGTLRGRIERVDQGGDLARTLTRAELEASHRFRDTLAGFLRWSFQDYAADLAPADEYTYHLLSASLRVTW